MLRIVREGFPSMRKIFVVLGLLGHVLADDEYLGDIFVYKEAMEFVRACGNKELSMCIKERAVRYIDSLPNYMDLGSGLKIKSSEPERISRHATISSLPDEHRAREDALDNLLFERFSEFMKSHTFEYKVPDDTINDLNKSVEEGRKKKGGGMKMKSMMMILTLKAATIGAIVLKIIGMVAFKALLIAKVALTISSIIALKKLVETKHHTSTYEVVAAHPHYDEHNHFDRSFKHELPYRGYNGA
ncbi:uncharacterized protein Osi9 isoform X2 [Diabrotica undecimpunctata]|uniref:uncharacterized protein Osi9 isoform X2 n=1 Tax=Diabrotica undecimpunctata TaxID=50387 RepID=UPI003B63A7C9